MTDNNHAALMARLATLSDQLGAAAPLVQQVKAAGPEHDLVGAQLVALISEAVKTAEGVRADMESWADAVLP